MGLLEGASVNIELSWKDAGDGPRVRLVRAFWRGYGPLEPKEWAATIIVDGKTKRRVDAETKRVMGDIARLAFEDLVPSGQQPHCKYLECGCALNLKDDWAMPSGALLHKCQGHTSGDWRHVMGSAAAKERA
jgi:hypothetical protein